MSVVAGMSALVRDNPWPITPIDLEPKYFSLDAGGRDLVKQEIWKRDAKILVEVGTFMGGSAIQWLQTKPDLTVIGVDRWDGNWGPYIETMKTNPGMVRHLAHLGDVNQYIAAIIEHGNFVVAMNNLLAYRNRFVPVRRASPEGLHYLKLRKIVPDIVFIDANKELADVEAACELFPDALICGDDWNWRNPKTNTLDMQNILNEFCARTGFAVDAEKATWILRR